MNALNLTGAQSPVSIPDQRHVPQNLAPAIRPSFGPQLARAPLVPERILRAHHSWVFGDTRFRGAARLLQALVRAELGLEPGAYQPDDKALAPVTLGSRLRPDDALAGRNFTPEVYAFVRKELVLREEGAAIDEERLLGNMLSSMPLSFAVLAPLALDAAGLATRVFRELLPDFVDKVESITFETSPGRREPRYLDDGTAFDAAIHVITPDGTPATVFVEAKYSEGMTGPAARQRLRYDEVSRQVRLYRHPDSPSLRTLALEQFWRLHMLSQLAVDQSTTPQARLVVIGPQLNRRVMAACRCYQAELIDGSASDDPSRVGFTALTWEAVVSAIANAGGVDLARQIWGRYLDFNRVLQVVLGSASAAPPPSADTLFLPPARRARPASSTQLGPRRSTAKPAKVASVRGSLRAVRQKGEGQ